nr:NAD(P)-dependent oxidoreductase [Robbsia betulipollinis]
MTAPTLAAAGQRLLDEASCSVVYLGGANASDASDMPDAAEEIARLMGEHAFDAVISRTVTLSAAAIAACPSLRVISKHGVGVTNIDVAAATARGIPVYTTPATNAQSVAELTLGLMLAVARRLTFFDRELRAGRWTRVGDGVELAGRRLGLVGYGQIGQRVARFARALGMEVAFFDPALPADPVRDGTRRDPDGGIRRYAELSDLLAVSDVLSLHCPVTPDTRGLLNAAALARLPDRAIVLNTSRGELIDEAALAAALESGRLAGAGLDTFQVEPLPDGHPFTRLPNVVTTPHVGGSTPAALDAVAVSAVRNCLDFLDGAPVNPRACVNPEVL